MLQQGAVITADVQHARAGTDHGGNGGQSGAERQGCVCGVHTSSWAAWLRKPRTVANISGSSSRKASWPLSLLISTKLTCAVTAFRAWAMRLFSTGGNSQSLEKEMMAKRAAFRRNTSVSWPPCSPARSK